MDARMAQAKANLVLGFFLGSMASGSAAEAIVDSFFALLCAAQRTPMVQWCSGQLVSMWQGRQCSVLSHNKQG